FSAFHKVLADLLDPVVTMVADPLLALVLNDAVVAKLQLASSDVRADSAFLDNIVAATDVGTALARALDLLNKRWAPPSPPAAVRALTALADLMAPFLQGNLTSLIDHTALRQLLDDAQARLKDLVTALVPTRADISYDWQTGLDDFPAGDAAIFKMTAGRS